MNYDVIVIGAGAAGLTAAMYTARKKLKTLVISLNVGGQTNLTSHIENYPGFASISGFELMQKFEEQAIEFGAEITKGKVTGVFKEEDGRFKIVLSDITSYFAKALIITSGKIPRTMNVPGEEKFFGKGVSTCATCDGPMFSGKKVAMVGGNTIAIEEALELANNASKLYVIYSGEKLAAADEMVHKLQSHGNVEILLKSNVLEVKGDKFVSGVLVDINGERKELEVDGVFIELGYIVDTAPVKDLVQLNERHEIIINERNETSCQGVFAAGDVTVTPFKQTVISAGEGAKAGLEAYKYLSGGKAISLDWTH